MTVPTATKKRLSPTVTYLLSALAVGVPSFLSSGVALSQWRLGNTLSAASLAAIHILILGTMLTVAFGVLYQIIPIAFQAPPLPRHVFRWQLPVHLLAVTGMIWGFFRTDYAIVGWSGSLLVLNAGAYIGFVIQSYRQARNQTHVHRQLVWPAISLVGVVGLGLFQAFDAASVNAHVLLSHVLLGGLGFWGGLVLVISYKLVPMFSLSHGYQSRLPVVAGFYFGAIGIELLGQITGVHLLTISGVLATAVSIVGFSGDMIRILRARKRKRIVLPLKQALAAVVLTVVGELWVLLAWSSDNTHQALLAAYIFIFAGLVPMMLAYMQKIVPFLWFEYRFSKSKDRKTAPLIDDMVPKVPAVAGLVSYYLGIAIGFVYLVLPVGGSGAIVWLPEAFIALSCLGLLLLFYAFIRVVRLGGPRPVDDMPL